MNKGFWNSSFVICLFLQAFYMLSFNMATPLIAQYSIVLGASTAMAGLIAGMFSFLALLCRPIVGYASDRVSKKRALIFGMALGCVCLAGYGLSTSYTMVAAIRVFHALALCIQTTLISVVAIQYIPEERVAEGVGYVGVAAMIGMSLGPYFGVFISQVLTHSAAFFISAAFMAAGLILALSLQAVKSEAKATGKFSLSNMFDISALPLTITTSSFAYCAGTTTSLLVLLGSERGIDQIALFYLIASVGMVFIRPIAGRYVDSHGIKLLCTLALVSECFCMVILSLSNGLVPVIVAALFRTFGQGIGQASLQGQILKSSSAETRGRASATFYMGVDIGQGLGAIIGGAVASFFGYGASMLAALPFLMIATCALYWWLARHKE